MEKTSGLQQFKDLKDSKKGSHQRGGLFKKNPTWSKELAASGNQKGGGSGGAAAM